MATSDVGIWALLAGITSIENVGDKAILSKLFIPITTKSDTFLLSIVLLLACMVDRARLTGAPEISYDLHVSSRTKGGGRVVRWSLVNFQCRDVVQFGYSRARACCACPISGWGLFGHFYSPLSFLFSFSLSSGDGSI